MAERADNQTPSPSGSLREFRHELTTEQAVTLFELVGRSTHTNGLGDLYVALGNFVIDESGHVPGHRDYVGPSGWPS